MSQKIYETKAKGENDTADSVAKMLASLSEDVVNVLRILGVTVEQLINLARYNPQFGMIIGILTTNILSHKIDWLHWQHQELVCLDCNNLTVNPPTGPNPNAIVNQNGGIVGTLLNGFALFPGGASVIQGIVSLGQFFASHGAPGIGGGPGPGTVTQHQTAYVWVPGIIDQTANLIITGIIVSSFAGSLGGSVLSDITNITKITGASNPTPLVTPTPPNVEAGSQIKTNQTFTKGLGPEGS